MINMRNLFATFLLLICVTKSFCQLNYPLNINDMAQIKFPDKPVERSTSGNLIIYYYQGIQQSYVVNEALIKGPAVHSSKAKDDFFNAQVKLEVSALKGVLLYKKDIQIDGVNGVEYSYSFITQNVKIYNYNRFVYLNNVGIDYYIVSREPLNKNDKILSDYFNSFKITLPKKDINSL